VPGVSHFGEDNREAAHIGRLSGEPTRHQIEVAVESGQHASLSWDGIGCSIFDEGDIGIHADEVQHWPEFDQLGLDGIKNRAVGK